MTTTGDIRTGMRVVDSAGQDVGTVDEVRGGGAAGAGQDDGLIGDIAEAFAGGPDVHPQAAERLSSVGYIRIDRKGFLGGHGYVAADRIEGVDGDTVRLAIPADQVLDS